MSIRTLGRLTVLSLLITLVAACHESNSPFAPTVTDRALSVEDFVSSASVDSQAGALKVGSVPPPNSGPFIEVAGNPIIVNGGTTSLTVTSPTPFTTVYVSMTGSSLGISREFGSGLGGFYEVTLPAPTTSATLLLTFPQEIPTGEFELFFAASNANGDVGPASARNFSVIQVGTGDVQVTLSWDTDADVDLHVVGPSGEEVYYGNTTSASGGALDLDSNAACNTDNVRNENITWPVGSAPRGTYIVRVDYWSACGAAETNYTVLVNNGGEVQVASGRFTGDGDRGGLGSGVEVARFERTTGPAPTSAPVAPASVMPSTKQPR